MNTSNKSSAWYRHPLVWMLIIIPLSAVLGGISMIYLAVTTDDGLVNDDYYRRGKEINLVIKRDTEAKRLGLTAQLDVNPEKGILLIDLNNSQQLPNKLELSLLHATRANHDQFLTLTLTPEKKYYGLVEKFVPGKWYVQLYTEQWRLSGELQQPSQNSLLLTPK